MRLSIATRLFLALILAVLLVLLLNGIVMRVGFERAFTSYVIEQEVQTLSALAEALAERYALDGDWQSLRSHPRQWQQMLRRTARRGSGPPPLRDRPDRGGADGRPPGDRPDGPKGEGRDRRPPPDPLAFARRLSLQGVDGQLLAGRVFDDEPAARVPVLAGAQTVGYVVLAPQQAFTDRLDASFASGQFRSILVSAAAALALAALIAALLAREFTRPIRSLAEGARRIGEGEYDTRLNSRRGDELGDLARDFDVLADTLSKNEAMRRRWVADIAHELRTPLAVLRSELEALEDGVRGWDDSARQSLQTEVSRLSRLVADLHDLSVHDEGGLSVRREPLELGRLLSTMLVKAEGRLTAAGLGLDTALGESPLPVLADPMRIEQLLSNLLENSLRYTDAPGRVHVAASRDGDHACVTIADSSPGVPHAALPRLFDRLYRVDESRSRDRGGSGLGLAISRAIVEAHGGTLEAAASAAGGLEMTLRLPLRGETDA